jgi:ATP-binding cassette subfamily B protein
LWLNWKLALITFTVLPLLYVCAHIFRIKARDSYRNVRIRLASLNTFLQENVTGMSVVQIFTASRVSSGASHTSTRISTTHTSRV